MGKDGCQDSALGNRAFIGFAQYEVEMECCFLKVRKN